MQRRGARGVLGARAMRTARTCAVAISLAVPTGALLGACTSEHHSSTGRSTAGHSTTGNSTTGRSTAGRSTAGHSTTGRSLGIGPTLAPVNTSQATAGGAAPAGATTTVPDPGALPQTSVLPSAADPVFEAHVTELWRAVVDGNPTEAMPFFFPLSAYVQVKAIVDPVHDWQARLLADFADDVLADHAALGSSAGAAEFSSVSVGPDPVWVQPGAEYNKGSYWRVYGTTLHYVEADHPGAFTVASMISWRGQWYVVHLASIR